MAIFRFPPKPQRGLRHVAPSISAVAVDNPPFNKKRQLTQYRTPWIYQFVKQSIVLAQTDNPPFNQRRQFTWYEKPWVYRDNKQKIIVSVDDPPFIKNKIYSSLYDEKPWIYQFKRNTVPIEIIVVNDPPFGQRHLFSITTHFDIFKELRLPWRDPQKLVVEYITPTDNPPFGQRRPFSVASRFDIYRELQIPQVKYQKVIILADVPVGRRDFISLLRYEELPIWVYQKLKLRPTLNFFVDLPVDIVVVISAICTIQAKSTIITNLLYTSSILLELNLNSTIKQEVRLDGNICW